MAVLLKISVRFGHMHVLLGEAFFALVAIATGNKNNEVQQFR